MPAPPPLPAIRLFARVTSRLYMTKTPTTLST